MIEITQKEAECVIRHMDSLRTQFLEDREADFGEACYGCSHVYECKPDSWYENTRKLSEIAGMSINLVLPARQRLYFKNRGATEKSQHI